MLKISKETLQRGLGVPPSLTVLNLCLSTWNGDLERIQSAGQMSYSD